MQSQANLDKKLSLGAKLSALLEAESVMHDSAKQRMANYIHKHGLSHICILLGDNHARNFERLISMFATREAEENE